MRAGAGYIMAPTEKEQDIHGFEKRLKHNIKEVQKLPKRNHDMILKNQLLQSANTIFCSATLHGSEE